MTLGLHHYFTPPPAAGGGVAPGSATLDHQSESGEIMSYSTTYSLARLGTGSLTTGVDPANTTIGQRLDGSTYRVYLTFAQFDTSAIPAGATVDIATLSIKGSGDHTTQEFVIEARAIPDWGSLADADHISGADFDSTGTLVANYDTSLGMISGIRYNLADVALPANIVKEGSTFIVFGSDRWAADTTPDADDEYTFIDMSSSNEIRLHVEWS